MGEEEETKSRARGDSFETLRLSSCAALLCLHKEARKRKRKKEGTRTTLTPLSRPHTHTLDIYYLAPSSCPAPAPPPARARVTMAARQFYRKLCKDLPTIMEMYKLDELTSIGTLRNTLKELFYQNKKYTDPNVRQTTKRTQMLLFYLKFFSLTSLLSFVR